MAKMISMNEYLRIAGRSLAVVLLLAFQIDIAVAAVDQDESLFADSAVPLAKISYAREDGIERITFDLIEPLNHVAKRDGDELIVWFDQPRRFDLEGLKNQPGSKLKGTRMPGSGATRWLVLDLAPGSVVQSGSGKGQLLIITIKDDEMAPAVISPEVPKKRKAEKPVLSVAALPASNDQKLSAASQAPKVKKRDQVNANANEPASEKTGEALQNKAIERKRRPDRKMVAASVPRQLMPKIGPTPEEPLIGPIVAAATPTSPEPAEAEGKAPAKTSLPGEFEVDELAIDRALERTLTREGAVLMPFGMVELEPSISYVRREVDTPGLLNFFGFPAFGEAEIRRNDYVASLALRVGLPLDAQLEVDAPYTYVDQYERLSIGFDPVTLTEDRAGAFGDLRVGLAKTILKEGSWWPDVVGRVRWNSQTGKAVNDGVAFGGGRHELTGTISVVKSQDPLAFFGSVSYESTFEEDNFDPGDRIGVSIGTVLAASPDTSLRAALRQNFTSDAELDGDRLDGTDQMSATLSLGASSVLGRGILLDASADVGLTEDAPDYAARLSLPIRFNWRRAFSLRRQKSDDDG